MQLANGPDTSQRLQVSMGRCQPCITHACIRAQVTQAVKDGLYDDWDAVEGIWDHIFRSIAT